MTEHIAEAFNRYFRLVEPTTPELMKQVYSLRYHAYCLETGFERPEDYPDEMERDQYDEQSDHCLIIHRETNAYAATTRLVLADPENLDRPFPIELHSRIDRTDLVQAIPRHQIAEVSRFCVSKDFKRRAGERGTLAGLPTDDSQHAARREDERRTFPVITLALFTCMIRMTVRHSLTHWYAVMEPALIRYLKHLGMNFIPIGPATEYHGQRVPCIIKVQDLIDGVYEKDPQAWDLLTDYGKLAKIG